MKIKKKTVPISFVTTEDIQKALRQAAHEQERTVSWLVGKALEDYLVREGYLKKQAKPS